MVERYLRAAQIAPQERFELSSLVAIAMMVERGLGVSLVPDTALNLPDGQGVVRLALPEESQSRRFGVMWLRSSARLPLIHRLVDCARTVVKQRGGPRAAARDRKSTRLNSSHSQISYAVFCLKKKKKKIDSVSN